MPTKTDHPKRKTKIRRSKKSPLKTDAKSTPGQTTTL
jgi:hypothetical protein